MIIKVEKDFCIQKLPNNKKIKHRYEDLKIEGKFIKLPLDRDTGTIEVLYLNGAADIHSKMVTEIFAQVATAGA